MRRRDFIRAIGTAVLAWPTAAVAQQQVLPVIGFLDAESRKGREHLVAAFERGLMELGYRPGHNVALDLRWAESRFDRLPALAAELVHRQVSLIVASGSSQAVAAKGATTTIPIVFYTGSDPVQFKFVTSFNHPGGNMTGVAQLSNALEAKRLELLLELAPGRTPVGAILHADNAAAELNARTVTQAARTLGRDIIVLKVGTAADIKDTIATAVQRGAGALLVGSGSFLSSHRAEVIALAARYRVPASFTRREDAEAGGLMSYGASQTDAFRLVGVYAGRILKGENPAELPVVQPTTFELMINLKTARALGLAIPPMLLARATEVIE